MTTITPTINQLKEPVVIRPFKERPKKPDEECTLLTLAHRRYAYLKRAQYERRCEELREKARFIYHNNHEYRIKKLAQRKEANALKKAAKLAAETSLSS